MGCNLQLTLDVQKKDQISFDNFYAAKNKALLNLLRLEQGDNILQQFIYLFGSKSVGCSHLLKASCLHSNTLQKLSIFLPMLQLRSKSPSVFDGVEQLDLVCIDDIQVIAGIRKWEEALFNLFNRLKDSNTRLLVSAKCAPKYLDIKLPDLKSRLLSGLVFQVLGLNDEERLDALMLRAQLRALSISRGVARFMLQHSSQDMNLLFRVLRKVDHASLANQRRITVPFVKKVMNW